MTSLMGCGTNIQRFFSAATFKYPGSQLYAEEMDGRLQLRTAQQLTKDQAIAIEEHRQFHARLGDFGSIVNLNNHITLMIEAIKNGMAFIEAHMWALSHGAKPDQ